MTASSASACATTSLTTRPRRDHRRMVDQPVARRPRALGELWVPDRWAALRSVSSNLLLTCPAGQAPVRLDMAQARLVGAADRSVPKRIFCRLGESVPPVPGI